MVGTFLSITASKYTIKIPIDVMCAAHVVSDPRCYMAALYEEWHAPDGALYITLVPRAKPVSWTKWARETVRKLIT